MPIPAKELKKYKRSVAAFLRAMGAEISEAIRLEKYVHLVLASPPEGARATGFAGEKTGEYVSSDEKLSSGILYLEKNKLGDIPKDVDISVEAVEEPFNIDSIKITASCGDTELYFEGREVTPGYGLPDWYFHECDEKTEKERKETIAFYDRLKPLAEKHGFAIDEFWEKRILDIKRTIDKA